jgi:hypothetical protein
MIRMLQATVCAAALSCSGCAGDVIGTSQVGLEAPKGATGVPMPYYLPKGVVTMEIIWNGPEKTVSYVSDFKAVSVADVRSGPYTLWHRQNPLSAEKAEIKVDPATMLLSKVSSTATPQRTEALDQATAILKQTTALQMAMSGASIMRVDPGTEATGQPCPLVKVRASFDIDGSGPANVVVTPIVYSETCRISVTATVTPVGPGLAVNAKDHPAITSAETLCAREVCVRPPRLYRVNIHVKLTPPPGMEIKAPAIPPFMVSAPDTTTLAHIRFPGAAFAARNKTIDLSNGMLASYSVDNASEAVGFLTFTAAAVGTATAVAVLDRH